MATPVPSSPAPRPTPVIGAVPRPDPKPATSQFITSATKSLPPPPPRKPKPFRATKPTTPEPSPVLAPLVQQTVTQPAEVPKTVPTPGQLQAAPSVASVMGTAPPREVARDCAAWDTSSLSPITVDTRFALKMTDEARLRRAYLAKYVKGVVAACAMLCVVAAVCRGVSAVNQEPRATASPPRIELASAPPLPTVSSAVLPPAPPVAAPPTASAQAARAVPVVRPSSKSRRQPR
jgi:hypothetical protein